MKLLACGTFDLFHWGHVEFLRRCRLISTHVVAVVNDSEFVSQYKHPPVMSTKERFEVVKACRYVDEVLINPSKSDFPGIVKQVKPNIIAVGTDWAVKDYYEQTQITREEMDKMGIVLVYLDYTKEISSTMIRERLK